jgi:hypothetical protein
MLSHAEDVFQHESGVCGFEMQEPRAFKNITPTQGQGSASIKRNHTHQKERI